MAINVEMPFEKARQQMAQWRNYAMPMATLEVDNEPPEAPNVLVDAVSLGGPSDPKQKPLVRHVIVKDLHKIGTRLKYVFPKVGVFSNKASMGLYALFDGQSCAGEAGPMAAEFCARNFHTKLLERLSSMPASPADRGAVEAALRGAFEDLDEDIITKQLDVMDGCGAAVALLIGSTVFTAALGRCGLVLSEREGAKLFPLPLGGGQRQVDSDLRRLRSMGGMVVADGNLPCIRHPSGAMSRVSRSLGDRHWKSATTTGGPSLIIRTPEVMNVSLKAPDSHPLLLLVTSSVMGVLGPQELVNLAGEFQVQPRATCGEIATRAYEARAGAAALAQCTAVEVCFLPARTTKDDKKRAHGTAGPEPPQAKKAKVTAAPGGETQSVRLRHIMLKFNDGPQPQKDGPKKVTSRSRQDAEATLRRLFFEMRKDVRAMKKAPKDSTELVNATTKKFTELCKEHSECETARKGGSMCGDIGWVTPEDRGKLGGSFKEVVDVLLPGQFSDIAVTEQGVHLVQRIA